MRITRLDRTETGSIRPRDLNSHPVAQSMQLQDELCHRGHDAHLVSSSGQDRQRRDIDRTWKGCEGSWSYEPTSIYSEARMHIPSQSEEG